MNDVTPENAGFFNLPDATGAIVSQVTPDSPAGRAGLKSGDVLRELNGKKIANGGALQVAVSETTPGTIDWAFCATASPRHQRHCRRVPQRQERSRLERRAASNAASSASPWITSRPTCASSTTCPTGARRGHCRRAPRQPGRRCGPRPRRRDSRSQPASRGGRRQLRESDPRRARRQRRPASGLVQRRRKLSRGASWAERAERM